MELMLGQETTEEDYAKEDNGKKSLSLTLKTYGATVIRLRLAYVSEIFFMLN